MQIAILQTEGRPADPDYNLALLARHAARAAAAGAELLIGPELLLSGYRIGAAVEALAEPADGPALRRAAAIAREQGLALLFGYPERDGDSLYNSACLLDRHGRRLANYRKTHLYGDEERRWFRPGDGFVTATLNGVKIGLLICYDVEFPEAVRAQALAGCDLVAVPTALMTPQDFVATRLVPSRAIENGCYVVYVNRCGREHDLHYVGLSCVIAPDGSELARAGRDEALLFAEIDPQRFERWRREVVPYLSDRRPELYRP